ncbi:efflux transporter outer membrane subunit [Robertkochia flava]|uniref:efflux transporter outer membrane subunit n=1 Tax=Robertkochia flava TaxID=3447986 RepID=UPI001CCE98F9|nr:efflux transporter outer membrane subunit [Robertkochia marina]
MRTVKYIKIVLWCLASGMLLQSCFVARNYERPEVEELEAVNLYRNVGAEIDSQSVAEISWRNFFQDTLLHNYIEEALANNIDLQIAAEQVLIAESLLKQGKAGYLPRLDTQARFNDLGFSENMDNRPPNLYTQEFALTGGLSWEADVWGRIRSNKRALEASFYRSDAVKNAISSSLVSGVASLYYELLSLDAKLALVKRAIENRSRAVEAMRGLKEAGMANEVGVQQILALKYNSDAVEVNVENQIRLLENALSVLLGRVPGPLKRGNFRNVTIDVELETGVPYRLLQNRPDIVASEYAFREAFELTNVARSNFYPTFTLSASGGFLSSDLDDWFNASSLFSNLMAGLTQPIFRQREIRTGYEVAQSQQQQAFLDFRLSLLNAGKEVSDALYNIDAAQRLSEIKMKELEANTKATRFAAILLTQGYADYIEVLNANTNQLISEFEFVNFRLQELQSKVELYRALGGGWR